MSTKTRPGDVHPGTSLTIEIIDDGFRLETRNVSQLGEPKFTEFTRSGTRSPETLCALDGLFNALRANGKRLRNGGFEWRLPDGILQMMEDIDHDRYIRVWNEDKGTVCVLTFTKADTPEWFYDALMLLNVSMRLDCVAGR